MLLEDICIISWLSVNSNWSCHQGTLNRSQIVDFRPLWHWNLNWTRKRIGHLFHATSSFVHHFVVICEFKLGLQSGSKLTDKNIVWPLHSGAWVFSPFIMSFSIFEWPLWWVFYLCIAADNDIMGIDGDVMTWKQTPSPLLTLCAKNHVAFTGVVLTQRPSNADIWWFLCCILEKAFAQTVASDFRRYEAHVT